MSKELIEQLAKEHGALDMELSTFDLRIFTFSLKQLEAFAKAYQAAAPIDNGMQLIEKLNKTIGDLQGDNYEPQDVLNAVLDIIEQALIPDTQAYAQTQGQSNVPVAYSINNKHGTPIAWSQFREPLEIDIQNWYAGQGYYIQPLLAAPIAVDADAERK
jgi:hypothetical protein